MTSPEPDPMPDEVLQDVLEALEPHRERLEPVLRSADRDDPSADPAAL